MVKLPARDYAAGGAVRTEESCVHFIDGVPVSNVGYVYPYLQDVVAITAGIRQQMI